MKPREPSHAVIARLALRRGAKDRHATIKAIQNNNNSARLCCASLAQRAERTLSRATAQVS